MSKLILPRARYERERHRQWLLFDLPYPQSVPYEMTMLQKNDIPGLLPLSLRPLDERLVCAYDVTSRVDLLSYTARHLLGAKELRTVFREIPALIERLEEYLMEPRGILFDPRYLYLDPEGKPAFCYLAFLEEDLRASVAQLADGLLDRTDPEEEEALLLICRIRFLLKKENWEEELAELVKESPVFTLPSAASLPPAESAEKNAAQPFLAAGKSAGLWPFAAGKSAAIPSFDAEKSPALPPFAAESRDVWEEAKREDKKGGKCPWWKRLPFFRKPEAQADREALSPDESHVEAYDEARFLFDEDPVLPDFMEEEEGSDGTRVLARHAMTAQNAEAWLIPEGVHEASDVLHLPRRMLLLGKQRPTVDIVLPSPAASRLHARVFTEGDEYFLADLNSKNGTYLNGEALVGFTGSRMTEGDRVRFADLHYRFTRVRNGR